MKSLVNLLGLFEEATTFLGNSTYATLSLIYPTISELQVIFEAKDLFTLEVVDFTADTTILDNEDDEQEFFKQPENEKEEVIDPVTRKHVKINQPMNTKDIIKKIKYIILQALHQYWKVSSDVALKAAFLDPRFKDLAFTRNEKNQIIQLIQDELNLVTNITDPLSKPSPDDEIINILDDNPNNGK